MDLNYENRYNQNFSGLYCTCQRPYPDPENADEDEMLQCVVCEDWLHLNHLNATVPANDQYEEMVCQDCMEDNDFLHDYSDMVINVVDKEIIVTDPDLDISESYFKKDKMVNGSAKDNEKDTDKVEAEPKIDNQTSEEKKEETADVDTKEDKSGDSEKVSEKTEKESEELSEKTEDKEKEEVLEKTEEKDSEAVESTTEPSKDTDATINTETETKDSEGTAETNLVNQEENALEKSETEKSSVEVENKSDQNVLETKPEEMDEATKERIEEDKLLNDEPEKPVEEDKLEATVENTDKPVEEKKDTDITEPITNGHDNKRKLSTEEALDSLTSKKAKVEAKKCIRPRGVKHLYKGATFWPSDFRQRLCTCNECIDMYKDLAVLFLTDIEDTVTAYEALGKERIEGPSSQYEKGLQALSSLDRVHQINALTEYNKMKDKLLDFLKSFKDKKEIVKEEDIKAFFAGMKPKREPDGVYFCR